MKKPAATRPLSAVLWIIPLVYFIFVVAEIALMTHMALLATSLGRSVLAVGVLSSAFWGGILLGSLRAHALVQRHGHALVFVCATALSGCAVLAAALHEWFYGWAIGALVVGLGSGVVWVAGEAWLAEAAPAERRGFFVGLFETSVGLGLMVGPALVPLMRWLGLSTPWVSAALMLLAVLTSLALLKVERPGSHTAASRADHDALRQAARAMALPIVVVSVISGLMESGVSALLPSISMRLGFSLETAAWLGAVIGAGSALLQPPAGMLADRFGTQRIALLAWLIVLLANVVLLLAAANPAVVLWGVGFTLGGVGGAVYTLMIAELGHRLSGPLLVRAIGLLVTAYSLGTMAGPALGGGLFDAGGLVTLAGALLLLSLAGLVVTYLGLSSKPIAPTSEPKR